MVLDSYDEVDRGLLHALQVDARAPFRRIAEVLGVSDQTIARRYGRLRESGVLRVVALSAPEVMGDVHWTVRVGVDPDGSAELATELARRHDTSWISTCAGGSEIVGSLHGVGRDPELLDVLGTMRHVREVHADRVLRVFYGGPGEPYAKDGPLTAEQVDALARHLPAPAPAPARLDDTDRRLLAVLRGDGRTGVERIADLLGVSTATARRRLHDLRAGRAVHFDVDVDLRLLGRPIHTLVRLVVDPGELTAAGEQLAGHRAVTFSAATTGPGNLFASVTTSDTAELYDVLTATVAALPGHPRTVGTAAVRHTYKAVATSSAPASARPAPSGRTWVASSSRS